MELMHFKKVKFEHLEDIILTYIVGISVILNV